MITAAQLRMAARLVDRGWLHDGWYRDLEGRYCVIGATIKASDLSEGETHCEMQTFEDKPATHNDAPDCTKDGAVMFLLVCAEAREHGDL